MHMNTTTINLAKLVPKSIFSRDIVRDVVENEINKINEQTINLDFGTIEFISRSAAHELLKMRERFEYDKEQKKQIVFKNLNTNVAEMIRVVAASSAYSTDKKVKFSPKRVSITDLVKV